MPNQPNEDIPVYLFVGFLESGKTKFIQETLEDKRFNNGERTLLLICEEGEEEFDPSRWASKNVVQQVLTDQADFTPEKLEALRKEARATRVVLEYNGMWTINDLFEQLPLDWAVYQAMCFVDSNTFLQCQRTGRVQPFRPECHGSE